MAEVVRVDLDVVEQFLVTRLDDEAATVVGLLVAEVRQLRTQLGREIVHRCPPGGAATMPCCGRTPFEVPATDRLTLDNALVTCHG